MPLGELGAYLAIGALVGFFAGLLGVGGGLITVSALALMFTAHGFAPPYIMHLAVGTSLAAIVSGSWSSFRTHHRHGAVDWPIVRRMTPGILAGVAVGAGISHFLSNALLKYFFLTIMFLVTAQMVFNVRPKPSRDIPGNAGLAAMGIVAGLISSLMGGGAAAVCVPFLTWCNMSTHRAIGTVAAIGFPLSIAGTIAYAASGWNVAGLPPWSVGFVYLPAFIGISVTSALVAPYGARLAHRLKGPTLRRIFAVFLVLTGLKVAISV